LRSFYKDLLKDLNYLKHLKSLNLLKFRLKHLYLKKQMNLKYLKYLKRHLYQKFLNYLMCLKRLMSLLFRL
jgi:hypothetical protein